MVEHPDPAGVAAGLTKAQRRAIADAFQASWGEWYVPSATRWDVRWRLVEKGILSKRSAQPLRKLGLAVLQSIQDGEQG